MINVVATGGELEPGAHLAACESGDDRGELPWLAHDDVGYSQRIPERFEPVDDSPDRAEEQERRRLQLLSGQVQPLGGLIKCRRELRYRSPSAGREPTARSLRHDLLPLRSASGLAPRLSRGGIPPAQESRQGRGSTR